MKRFVQSMILILLCLLFCSPALAQSVPYTVKLDASVAIYRGNGVHYGYVKSVGEDGVYTIVEEAYDEYDNLWGKLKSGAGWVLLEAAEAAYTYNEVPYTISLKADEVICERPNSGYIRDVGEDGVYTIVEEAYDEAGNLCGKLKSGAGWVMIRRNTQEYVYSEYQITLGAWVPIYNTPDEMNATCVGIVGEDGVYTIIAEVQDELGNVWGELKSGVGWVNLNYVRFMGQPPLTAYFADVIDSIDAGCCDVVVDNSEYIMTRIAFRANERLNNVKFTTLQYGDTYEVEKEHYWIHWLEEDEYFVAGVVFYGDMTTYGISFVDEDGEERYYAVSISGMNGALVMNEYIQ